MQFSAPPCTDGAVRLLRDRVQTCQGQRWGYVCYMIMAGLIKMLKLSVGSLVSLLKVSDIRHWSSTFQIFDLQMH